MGTHHNLKSVWIFWYTIALHWVWGVTLLASNAPLRITAIDAMTRIGLVSAPYVGIMYIVGALLAMLAMAAPKIPWAIFLIPQQILVIVSAYGALRAMSLGMFADGVIRPYPFLIADQAPAVVLAVTYMIAIYANYVDES